MKVMIREDQDRDLGRYQAYIHFKADEVNPTSYPMNPTIDPNTNT
jgi:hypothetical protein